MKKLKPLIFILIICLAKFACATEPVLVIDRIDGEQVITNNFRSELSSDLHASASGQFSPAELKKIIAVIPQNNQNIWVVDLRQESHGFINDIAVSWYGYRNQANIYKSGAEIRAEENCLLDSLCGLGPIQVYRLRKLPDGKVKASDFETIHPRRVYNEETLVNDLGAKYKRFFVLDHHRPDDATVDDFISFVRTSTRRRDWLHFHCRGGKGRSSSFMAMYDMIRNAKSDTFTTIMERQVSIGNVDLSDISKRIGKEWKQPSAKERYDFLQKFYEYASEGYPGQTWSQWILQDK